MQKKVLIKGAGEQASGTAHRLFRYGFRVGTLQTQRSIGDRIDAGQKVGDIDPRGDPSFGHSHSDKTRTISGAALGIIFAFFNCEPAS